MKILNIKCQKFRVNVALVITGILENTKIMRRKHTLKKKKKKTLQNFKKKKKKKGTALGTYRYARDIKPNNK